MWFRGAILDQESEKFAYRSLSALLCTTAPISESSFKCNWIRARLMTYRWRIFWSRPVQIYKVVHRKSYVWYKDPWYELTSSAFLLQSRQSNNEFYPKWDLDTRRGKTLLRSTPLLRFRAGKMHLKHTKQIRRNLAPLQRQKHNSWAIQTQSTDRCGQRRMTWSWCYIASTNPPFFLYGRQIIDDAHLFQPHCNADNKGDIVQWACHLFRAL